MNIYKRRKRRPFARGMVEIDGALFARKKDGMVLVDAWYLPAADAPRFIAQREACAAAALQAMRTWCADARRDWAGSQDGEGILGLDAHGRLIACVHLDPQSVEEMSAAMQQGRLIDYLKDINTDAP